MVYFDPSTVGTKLLVDAWLKNDLPEIISDKYTVRTIKLLFDWLLEPCLDFIINSEEQIINCSKMHLTVSFLKLYKSFLWDLK